MLMVVFGAGASFDSCPEFEAPGPHQVHVSGSEVERQRPPLTKDLFSPTEDFGRVLQMFPQCHAVVERLRHMPEGRTLEQELEAMMAERVKLKHRHRQLAAVRYYLQRVLWEQGDRWYSVAKGVTNYATLLGRLEDWRVLSGQDLLLVTFNYDTLLDRAYGGLYGDPGRPGAPDNGQLEGYIAHRVCPLIKIHGSVNWGHLLSNREWAQPDGSVVTRDRREMGSTLIEHASELSLSGGMKVLPALDDPYAGVEKPTFPALAVPVVGKSEFECPKAHQELLRGYLPRVTAVVIIGWRAAEQHYLSLWGRDVIRLVCIVGSSRGGCQETLNNLASRTRVQSWKFEDNGFTGFMRSAELEKFLDVVPAETPAS